MKAEAPAPEVVGVLGGTFDPVHDGHLRIADAARRTLGLSRTLLMPAALPPHKVSDELAPAHHREAMLRLAVRGRPGLEIDTLELRSARVSFTIDTLRRLRDGRPPRRPVFVLGMDALRQISSWRRWRELLREFDLAVVDRSEDEPAPEETLQSEVARRLVTLAEAAPRAERSERLEVGRGGRVFRLPMAPIPVSSSEVRARARTGGDLSRLVPPAVARYIQDMGLYRQEKDR